MENKSAVQFVRWYFKIVWNIVRDEPPPNTTVEPCHCGKKHWGYPCKGWMFKDKSVAQLKRERKPIVIDVVTKDIDKDVAATLKNKPKIQKELVQKLKGRRR